MLNERKQRDKLFPAREKEGKIHTEFDFLIDLVVCIGYGNARMGRKKSQGKVQHKNVESILETVTI